MVPLFDIKLQHQLIAADLVAAFQRVLASGQFILGPEVEGFERGIAQLAGTRHAIGVSSGTDAILLALMAAGIGPGDEVICPSFTFFATAGCIARTGARPIFADCCPVCFNLDVADAARRITPRTKAIIPVHLFGQAADMDSVMALARQHELFVIEDAAQALGAEYHTQKVGSLGSFGAFSFFPTKNLGGLGDAGMLVTNDEELAERARLLRTHGAKHRYFHELVGANFRIDALQAALLAAKLPHYQQYTQRRCANAAYYLDKLSLLPRVRLADTSVSACLHTGRSRTGSPVAEPGVILPVAYAHNSHIWNQFTLRVPGPGQRDELKQRLAARRIGCEVYYPVPMHRQQCFADQQKGQPALPISEQMASECLSLPIYPELERPQLDEVIDGIRDFVTAP